MFAKWNQRTRPEDKQTKRQNSHADGTSRTAAKLIARRSATIAGEKSVTLTTQGQ